MTSWIGSSSAVLEQQKLNNIANINTTILKNVGKQKIYTPAELKQLSYTKQNYISPYSFGGIISQGQVSHSRLSLYKSDNAKRKKKNDKRYPKEKKYQIYEHKSNNGYKTYYKYYVNGVQTDAFGRAPNEVGFTQYGEQPIYPKSPDFIPLKVKKNKKFRDRGISGLASSINLEFEKMDTHIKYTQDVLKRVEEIKKEANDLLDEESANNTATAIIGDVYNIKQNDLFATLYNKSFAVDIATAEDFATDTSTETTINADGSTTTTTTNTDGSITSTTTNTDGSTTTTTTNTVGTTTDGTTGGEESTENVDDIQNTIDTLTQQLQTVLNTITDYENQISALEDDIDTWETKIKKEKKKTVPNLVKIATWEALILAAEASIIAINGLVAAANLVVNEINNEIQEQQDLLDSIQNAIDNVGNVDNVVDNIVDTVSDTIDATTDTGKVNSSSSSNNKETNNNVKGSENVSSKTDKDDKKSEKEKTRERKKKQQNISHETRNNLTVKSLKILSEKGRTTHGLTNHIYYPPPLLNNRMPYNLYKPKGTFTNKNHKVL